MNKDKKLTNGLSEMAIEDPNDIQDEGNNYCGESSDDLP